MPLAKLHGVKTTIIHAHYASTAATFKGRVERLVLLPLRFCADFYFACSREAGLAVYGEGLMSAGAVKVLPNAIDLNRFSFSPDGVHKEHSPCYHLGFTGTLNSLIASWSIRCSISS